MFPFINRSLRWLIKKRGRGNGEVKMKTKWHTNESKGKALALPLVRKFLNSEKTERNGGKKLSWLSKSDSKTEYEQDIRKIKLYIDRYLRLLNNIFFPKKGTKEKKKKIVHLPQTS